MGEIYVYDKRGRSVLFARNPIAFDVIDPEEFEIQDILRGDHSLGRSPPKSQGQHIPEDRKPDPQPDE